MINVAMLSFWHVHADEYKDLAIAHPKTKIVAVWDELPERGKMKAQELGVPFYSDLEDLLSNTDIHGVIVDAPTNVHYDVISKAIKAKKHVFTEKVLTARFEEAVEISNLVDQNNVALTLSLPRVNTWYTQAILQQLSQGVVGDVNSTRVRISHNGSLSTGENPGGWLPGHFYSLEQCMGGALMDLGAHPVYLTRLFLGLLPKSAYAEFAYITDREVEDISTGIFQTESGAIGTIEVTFINSKSPFSIEIHGSDGFISYSEDTNEIKINSIHNKDNSQVVLLEKEFSGELSSDFDQWILNIEDSSNAKSNLALGIDLTKMMEACYSSQKTGKKVSLN